MARARDALSREHGRGTFHQIMFNLAEYQAHKGGDGYRWDGEAWFGGDINRLTLKSEGEGAVRGGVDSAEVQALYSRAIDPYWNLQAGVRQDIRPRPARAYATIGVEGLMPYMFEVEGALFLSNKDRACPTPNWGCGCAMRSSANSRLMLASPTIGRSAIRHLMPDRMANMSGRPAW
jgi:copper resistance protein B